MHLCCCAASAGLLVQGERKLRTRWRLDRCERGGDRRWIGWGRCREERGRWCRAADCLEEVGGDRRERHEHEDGWKETRRGLEKEGEDLN
uniref:Uncharacterized protein n=1 Tax=Arundo donax TaxID=35708 RepID=A0A0A9CAV6_ARUDO